MKKFNFWLGMLVTVLAFGMTVVGCASVENTLMNPDVSVEDHAVLSVPAEINNITINGEAFKSGSDWATRVLTIVLPPGEHTIQARYHVAGDRTVTQSNFITIVHNFKAGGRYYILANTNLSHTTRSSLFDTTVGSGTINFVIVDETDPTAAWAGTGRRHEWAEERVTKINSEMARVRYPSRLALSFTYGPLMENAANAGLTKFEGSWGPYTTGNAWSGIRTHSYRFTGNLYLLEHKSVDGQYTVYIERGTFEFNDNIITLTAFQRDAGIITVRFVNLPKPTVTQYEYSITDEGLVLRTNRETLGPFNRQN